ncbi:MAG: MBL fold metallo-hydrolase [Flavobacteriales bacterium]|nr:MBL fold metallo-hydrolase [Flavobacteriales bacterium]
MNKQFGARPNRAERLKFSTNKQWNGKRFVNLETTRMEVNFYTLPKILYKQFFEKEKRTPSKPIPVETFDMAKFLTASNSVKYIWYGHSVVLLRLGGKTILIDPMMGSNAAPISPFAVRRFSSQTLNIVDEWPEIDAVLLTHDHYDHLDYDSIQKLRSKVKNFYVALGVKRHLEKWGVEGNRVHEFSWWDSMELDTIKIFFTPTRHFSGRGIGDHSKSLWGGWVIRSGSTQIWFSGDGGYGAHFKDIGKKFSTFDLAFMECGQYNKYWHQIHMFPEESVMAGLEAGAKVMVPVHWAGFALAQHSWTDPVQRFIEECQKRNAISRVPSPGSLLDIMERYELKNWWEEF